MAPSLSTYGIVGGRLTLVICNIKHRAAGGGDSVGSFSASVAFAVSRPDSALFDHHSLPGEFGNRFARFAEAFATHALQHCLVFRKLNIRVFHDLHAVPPGISELHPSPRQDFGAGFLELLSHLLLVVYHEAQMALLVWRLSPTFGESND